MRRRVLGFFVWVLWPAAGSLAALATWPPLGLPAALWLLGTLLPAVVWTTYRTRVQHEGWGWLTVLTLFAWSCAVAYGGIVFLARYWLFFHLGTPVSGLWLVMVVYPVLVLASARVGLGVLRSVTRRAQHKALALASALGAVLLCVGVLLTWEVWQSTGLRSGEGRGAGDLTPFFASLLR